MIKWYGPVAVGVVVVAAVGAAHGLKTDRWQPSARLEEAVARLPAVPMQIGDWAGKGEPLENEEDVKRVGQIKEYINRAYTNTQAQQGVTLLVVCGRGGPISVHTPDICYAGAGYRRLTDPTPTTVEAGGRSHSFRMARFAKPGGVSQGQIEILWAWSADGREWSAPDKPRAAFARLPAVYKMYVVRPIGPAAKAGEAADPARAFLREALPAVADALDPPAAAPAAPAP